MSTKASFFPSSDASPRAACETALLGSLGGELAAIYHETLQAPLPSGLQAVMDRLDAALRACGDSPSEDGCGAG